MRGAPVIGVILLVLSGCASPPALHSNRMLGGLQLRAEIPGAHAPRFPIPPLAPEAEAARQRAIAMLVQRGVRFPISREDVGFRDPGVPPAAN